MEPPLNFLRELHRWLYSSAAKFRAARQFATVSHLGVALDINGDAIRDSNALAAAAHRAETCAREAARLITAASRPESEGGAAITPAELRPIARLIHRSAELDHDIAERAHVPA